MTAQAFELILVLLAGLLAPVSGGHFAPVLQTELAGVSVTPNSGLITAENGTTAQFTIALEAQPTADVVINLVSSRPEEGLPDLPSVTFTPETWETPFTVVVTGQPDSIDDGDQAYTIITTLETTDPDYSLIDPDDVSLTNTDLDTAGVYIQPTGPLVTSESGGAVGFSAELGSRPTAPVTVQVQSLNTAEGTVSPAEVTIQPHLWHNPVAFTITGADDSAADGDQSYTVAITIASSDPIYAAIDPDDLSLTNTDNDAAGVTVSTPDPQQTSESGGSTSFQVDLHSRPTAPVTVFALSSDLAEGAVSPSEVTIQPDDWQTAAAFSVTGADDDLDDGDQGYTILLTLDSSDPLYDAIDPADVNLTNLDDDTAGINVTATTPLVTGESGSTAVFSLALTSRPTEIVTLHAQSSDLGEGTVAPATVDILPGDWQQPVDFTVTGVQDLLLDGDQDYTIDLWVTSADPLYAGVILSDLTAQNLDDDQDTPVDALPDSYTTAEDTDLTVPASGLLANDSGPGTLSVVIPLEQNPSSGQISINPDGSFTYSPNDNFNGADQFSYRATNGVQTSNTVTVSLTVTPVNDAPVAVADTYLTNAVNPGALLVPPRGVLANDTDIDSATLTAEVVSAPTSGSLTLNTNGSFRYVPAIGQVQNTVTFTYRTYDGGLYSAVQTVTINIDAVPPAKPEFDLPVASGGTFEIAEGTFELRAIASADTARVEFYRWDALLLQYRYDLGQDDTLPFQVTVPVNILNLDINEIFVKAYDEAGNVSEREHLWVNREPLLDQFIYLPSLSR